MLRITGGTYRGRMLHTPAQQGTRPTQAMLRQALFNSIQMHVPEARVLDLFAGSGALGFEALSRGASEVIFVEHATAAIKCIRQNIEDLKVTEQVRLYSEPMERVLPAVTAAGPFDLVLADPPYLLGWEEKLLNTWPWESVLAPAGILCLEWSQARSNRKGQAVEAIQLPAEFPFLVKIREKSYGESVLTTYQKKEA